MSDWKAITDDREKYKAYLCSREWALLRNAVRERCGGKCERCGVNEMQCVHHLTYAQKYHERLEDLAGWCNACHEFTHGKSDRDPKPAKKWVDVCEFDDPDFSRSHFIRWSDEWHRSVSEETGDKNRWVYMFKSMVLGMAVAKIMGTKWLARAADGEFQKRDSDVNLHELIIRRRKEQGIT